MHARTALAAVLTLAIAMPATAETYDQCVERFENKASAESGSCGSAGCFTKDGKSVTDVCGVPILTDAEKRELLDAVTSACHRHGSGNFDLMSREVNFSLALQRSIFHFSDEEKQEACRIGGVRAKQERDAMVIKIGSSEEDMVAKFGKPDTINKTVTSGLIHKQYVYGSTYVYTVNGVITAFQTSE